MDTTHKIACIQLLLEEILDIQKENHKNTKAVQRVEEIIKESNDLITDSGVTNEIVLDAKILQTGSQVLNSNISSIDTNLTTFNEAEYKSGILSFLKHNSDFESPNSWECFSPITYHLYRKSETPAFMMGSLSFDPLVVKEKGKVQRNKKVSEAKTELSRASGSSQRDRKETEDSIYEHILKSLVKCYVANERKPLNFLKFIMNPNDYWDSVQNIFYFSFLVRDGRVNMFLDDKGMPVVEPILKTPKAPEGSRIKTNHFCFSLNKKQWRDCIKKFNISSPMIKPLKLN